MLVYFTHHCSPGQVSGLPSFFPAWLCHFSSSCWSGWIHQCRSERGTDAYPRDCLGYTPGSKSVGREWLVGLLWGLVSSEGRVEGECFMNRVLARLDGTPLNAVLLQGTGGLDRRLIQRGRFCKRSLVAPMSCCW